MVHVREANESCCCYKVSPHLWATIPVLAFMNYYQDFETQKATRSCTECSKIINKSNTKIRQLNCREEEVVRIIRCGDKRL